MHLQPGQRYQFHMDAQEPTSYTGRFLSYSDDGKGQPTMVTIRSTGGTNLHLPWINILAIVEVEEEVKLGG
jgi:hypothetical protein